MHHAILDKISAVNELREVIEILIIKEVEYAVRILDELYHEGTLSAAELSKRRDIPSPFIYRVLKKLGTAGILRIRRGPRGGYELCRPCGDLTLYDVIRAFENTFLVIECMKEDYTCINNKDSACGMHRQFRDIQEMLKEEFNRNSLAYLLQDSPDEGENN